MRGRTHRDSRRLAAAFAVVIAVLGGGARAEDKDQARAAYQRGSQHYDLGEYLPALDSFKEAYRNFEDPVFLFNIAQCHRQLGNNEQAVREYRMYLVKLPDAANRPAVEALVAELDKTIAEEHKNRSLPPPGTVAPRDPQPASSPAMAARPVNASADSGGPVEVHPISREWWLWTAVGGAVAAAVAVGLGVGLSQSDPVAKTALGTFRF